MIDTQLLGETAAKCMESLDDHEALDGGKLVSVGIIVVAEDEKGSQTFTRIYSSDQIHYRQIGLFQSGLDVATTGTRFAEEEDDDE